ncbi:MAG TPA: hypothetical protein VNH16_24150 [Burkholderiales bacterium]|nr:hypothetical protein [Burkholderiales bacterium]
MTKRTWWYTLVTTLLISGLAACSGGGGGGGGGGGSGIPSATNAAITPPPTTPVTITSATAGQPASQTNQTIGANGFQASDGAKNNASAASGLGQVSAQADNSGTPQSETFGAIVRRHAEKLKDHKSSVTGALQVETEPCSGGGTSTFAFDDASQSATEVFVGCNEGGTVLHGTLSSSNVGVSQNLGQTPGSAYSISVSATFTIDLSVTTTSPALIVVSQGSLSFTVAFSGNMVAAGNGVQPGNPNRVQISMSGSSLLSSTTIGTNTPQRSQLSNFNLSVDDNDTLGRTTVSGGYTFASTAINGSVTVNVTTPIVYQPQGSRRPSSGAVTITSSLSPGKIVVTVISSVAGVTVDVYANATDMAAANSSTLTWSQVDPT